MPAHFYYVAGGISHTMDALIQAFFRILLLRAGPQTIPPSPALMWLVLLLHFAIGFLLTIFTQPFGYSVLSSLVGTLIMVAVVHGLLLFYRQHARYLQTLSALAACEVLLGLMLLPLSLSALYSSGDDGSELTSLLAILWLMVVGWNVAVAAHIFRHALSVSMGGGFLYSIVYFIIAITVGDLMSSAGTVQ